MKKKTALVIGNNASKSLSPMIFNYWFLKYSIDGKYNYKEIKRREFKNKIKEIFKTKNICGFNVTTPFKERIIPYLDGLDKHAKEIGAVNCVTLKNNKHYGSNTDWIGYIKTLKEKTNKNDRINKEAIIIGYGGAAKAILYALLKLEYKKIYIFNRTPVDLKNLKNKKVETHPISKIKNYITHSNLIVNATPTNVLNRLNVSKILPPNVIVSDIVYNPMETKFLKHFKNPKQKVYGISMLINQAVPCFGGWFGTVPTPDEELLKRTKKRIDI